jgi:hypothetical protein
VVAEQYIGANLLQLRWSVPEERTADFEAWYDEEHLGDMVAVPGIVGGRRFSRVPTAFGAPTSFGFLTLYQLADLSPLTGPEFQRLVDEPSPWTRRVAFDLPLARTVYQQIHPEKGTATASGDDSRSVQEIGPALLHVMMSAEPSVEDEFNAWYNEEHVPALLSVPGVIGARRFRAVDDGASYGTDDPEAGLDFLAVYELADASVVETAAFLEAGRPTARRGRLGDAVRAHVQVYRQVFPVYAA